MNNMGIMEKLKSNFNNGAVNVCSMSIKFRCDICGVESNVGYGQNKASLAEFQLEGLNLCRRCFSNKHYPEFLTSEDFSIISNISPIIIILDEIKSQGLS